MKMTYETAEKIGDNLSQSQITYGREYDESILKYPNDVSLSHYDYTTWEANFSASTVEDVEN